ncbi:MAG: sialidase family protein, partial [Acidimicrobiia bacterium]
MRWGRPNLVLCVLAGVALVGAACGESGGDEGAGGRNGGSDRAGAADAVQTASGRVLLPERLDDLEVRHPAVVADGGRGQTLARDPDSGAVYMSWAREAPGREPAEGEDPVMEIVVARSADDGDTWSEPAKFHDDGFKMSGCPDVAAGLAADSGGRLHAAWYTGTDSHPGVYYAVSDDGVSFSQPVALLNDEWVPYADVRLVIDGDDQPWVAFEDRRGEVDQVQLVRIDPDTSAASFAAALPGHGPDLVAGDDWALLTWQSNPKSEDDERPGPLRALVA